MRILPTFTLLFAICIAAFATALDGTWNLQGGTTGAPVHVVISISGGTVTGNLDGAPIVGGTYQNNSIRFQAVRGGVTYTYKATVMNTKLNLYEHAPTGGGRLLIYARVG